MKGKVQTVFRILLISGIISLIVAILLSLLGTAYLLNTAREDISSLILLSGNKGSASKLYSRDSYGRKTEYAEGELSTGKLNDYAELDDIPDHLQNAFIAIEDKRFYSHLGFDPITTVKAAFKYVFGKGRSPGGSTITQQLIKNLTGDDDISIRRKINEIMRAIALEKELSKEAILELYLNSIYLSQGAYGVKAAAKVYFNKDVSELTLLEAASIAAITQAPTKWDPVKNPENNLLRRNVILKEMLSLGYITEEEFNQSYNVTLELSVSQDKVGTATSSWYTDAVINEAIQILCREMDVSEKAATQYLYNGGYHITTAVDPNVQAIIDKYYRNENLFTDTRVESSFVVIDPNTGAVLGIAGGIGEKNASRILNRATQSLRSPGSSIKPLSVYLPAVEMNKATYGSSYDDVPLYFTQNTSLNGWPENAGRTYSGRVSLEYAVSRSLNTVAVDLLDRIGLNRSYAFLESLGISTLDRGTDRSHSALALGGLTNGVSLLELVSAYTPFAANGIYTEPYFIYEITDAGGKVIYEREPSRKIVAREENVQVVTKLLQSVIKSPNGTAYQGITKVSQITDVAGKTGTTDNSHDRWFIGYTPNLVAGIWLGYDKPSSLSQINGKEHIRLWDSIMAEIEINLYPSGDKTFDNELLVEARYCVDSGMIPTEACYKDPRGGRIATGYFSKNTVPQETCSSHISVYYCEDGQGIANNACPKDVCYTVGLLVVNRDFPIEITVKDSQYTAMLLPEGYLPYYGEDGPYFRFYLPGDRFVGKSNVASPYNRACHIHMASVNT